MITALTNATVIDGTGTQPVYSCSIVIEDNIIKKIGVNTEFAADARVYDLKGKTVMPGMIDLHVHFFLDEQDSFEPAKGVLPPGYNEPLALRGIKGFINAKKTLEAGFTTVRDCGDLGEDVAIALKAAVNGCMIPGPRIITCGDLIAPSGSQYDLPAWLERKNTFFQFADGVTEVVKAVRYRVNKKNEWIKIMATGGINNPDKPQLFSHEEMKAIIDEAHLKNRFVCAHALYTKGILAAVRAGVDSIEHGSQLNKVIIDEMRQRGTYLVPTLSGGLILEAVGLSMAYKEKMKLIVEQCTASFQAALEAGVNIGMGSDAGFNTIRHGHNGKELEHMVIAGMEPLQAIVSATGNAAKLLRMDRLIGSIAEGKLADMIVIDGDPIEDISILQKAENILMVIKDGFIHKDILSF